MKLPDMPIILYIEMLRLTTHEKTRGIVNIEGFITVDTKSRQEHANY